MGIRILIINLPEPKKTVLRSEQKPTRHDAPVTALQWPLISILLIDNMNTVHVESTPSL